MGVRGLQTYIERNCPDACKSVSIKQMSDDHGRKFNCQPVIVVDGMALLNRLHEKSSLEWIYGGQWVQFIKELQNFIDQFKTIGVRLVLFFDGTVSASKRKEWVRRRVAKYEKIEEVFKFIKANFREPSKDLFMIPTSMGTFTRYAVKELGAEVYQTDIEADDVIVDYANKNKDVFAILSQDSDFIIYDTKAYLSLSHLDIYQMRTIFYDRNKFAARLGLQVKQLPLIACLTGNDFVPAETLRAFHRQMSNDPKRRIYLAAMAENFAGVIRRERWNGNFNDQREMDSISFALFGLKHFAEMIKEGLRSYAVGLPVSSPKVCIEVHPDVEKAVFERHCNCSNSAFVFNLLCNLEYESSEVLEDEGRIPCALAFREIRQRCYGVIFNSFHNASVSSTNGQTISVKEWCAYRGNYLKNPEIVHPLPLKTFLDVGSPNQMPKIEEIWFKFTETDKLRLFWSILQVPMEFRLLIALPKHLKVLACILNYSIAESKSGPLMQPWEVAVFVAQALCKKNPEDLKMLPPPLVDSNAVSLATLVMRGVTIALSVLSTCGLPLADAMPWRFFDGKLFHHLYIRARDNPNLNGICMNEEEAITGFCSLLSVVTNNTVYATNQLNWSTIIDGFVC